MRLVQVEDQKFAGLGTFTRDREVLFHTEGCGIARRQADSIYAGRSAHQMHPCMPGLPQFVRNRVSRRNLGDKNPRVLIDLDCSIDVVWPCEEH